MKRIRVLIIDDFLATGQTILALARIAKAAGAEIVGVGALIEKTFEGGRAALEVLGVPVHSLARIVDMSEGRIVHECMAADADRHVLGTFMGGHHHDEPEREAA